MKGDFRDTDDTPEIRGMAIECWRVQCENCDDWDLFFSDPVGDTVICDGCHTVIRIT